MSKLHNSNEIILTTDDFRQCGWQDWVDAPIAKSSNFVFENKFSEAAKLALDNNELVKSKALRLLHDACSMRLNPESSNEPFVPMMLLADGRRLAISDDLKADMLALAGLVVDITNPWLKARLADLAWLLILPKDKNYAQIAIDAYSQLPINIETWCLGIDKCFERAINLSFSLKDNACKNTLATKIYNAFELANQAEMSLALRLAQLILDKNLCVEQSHGIAQKLKGLARAFSRETRYLLSGEYYELAAKFYDGATQIDKKMEMLAARAESFMKEAQHRMATTPCHGSAAHHYENAIKAYRKIPTKYRFNYNVKKRVEELRHLVNIHHVKSQADMQTFALPTLDISESITSAQNHVKNKSVSEALIAFASILPFVNLVELHERATESASSNIFFSMFGSYLLAEDGRKISQRPSSGIFGASEAAIWENMIREYLFHTQIAVTGFINPAHDVLLVQNRLSEGYFIDLANQSPNVPKGRERLFGRALFAGYDNDFEVAIHLLTPQIEHLVRWHLKNRNILTTHFDKNGIETENGLSALVDLPEVKAIFGENIAFELKALFCDPQGANLRNKIAHGLLDSDACNSSEVVYAWWFGLKLLLSNLKLSI